MNASLGSVLSASLIPSLVPCFLDPFLQTDALLLQTLLLKSPTCNWTLHQPDHTNNRRMILSVTPDTERLIDGLLLIRIW